MKKSRVNCSDRGHYLQRVMNFTVELPHEPGSIPIARRELARLADEVDELTLRNTRLLVSELVTNAVRHVPAGDGDKIRLIVTREDGHLRVEVCDDGPGFTPAPRADHSSASSGWGLHIMAKIAARWGVEVDNGTRVWFEIEPAAQQHPV
jgi:anti-sigma regulatory factor (Ser/Thr protein kinase)